MGKRGQLRRALPLLFLAVFFLGLCSFALALYFSPRPDLWGGADFSLVFQDRAGRLLRVSLTSDEKYRIYTPLSDIPAQMQEATLLYEDRAFWHHPGVNPLAMGRALLGMLGGGRRMGASTITMQLARLSGKLDSRSISGKVRQMWRALQLERHYSKTEILEAYLNLAPYGANIEGVGAAARIWYGKDAIHLNLPEILALVPVPQHPAARNPQVLQGKALPAARLRLNALWEQAHPEEKSSLFASVPLRVYGPAHLPFEAPHVVNTLAGELGEQRERFVSVIPTTIDLERQKLLERCLQRAVARGRYWGMDNASALLLDWRSMDVVALAGSADFYNPAIQGQVDGTQARRSPGSTLKPFIYALALEQGLIHPQTILSDTPRSFRGYSPDNADSQFRGPISARQALQASRNIPAISLASRLKPPGLYGFLREAGVDFQESAEHYGLALVLGGAELSMRELVALYAMLPNRGLWRPLCLTPGESAIGRPCLTPEAAFVALDMLRAPSPQGFDRVISYWKTGTSNGQRDAWTVGVFGPYVLAVWVGRFDGGMNPGFTGLHAAAPLFFDIVQALSGIESLPDLPRQDRVGLNIRRVQVCAATGDLDTELCLRSPQGSLAETWFIPGVSPIKDSGILREILLDKESGLRQCREIAGRTERVVWEFWPGDMLRLFASAGISKPGAPPFAPECLEDEVPGRPPEISSPQAGLTYTVSMSEPQPIALTADCDSGVSNVFWFAGQEFLGASGPGDSLLWMPRPGLTELRAVDSNGKSARRRVLVESVP